MKSRHWKGSYPSWVSATTCVVTAAATAKGSSARLRGARLGVRDVQRGGADVGRLRLVGGGRGATFTMDSRSAHMLQRYLFRMDRYCQPKSVALG
jgi:hypothetical protein